MRYRKLGRTGVDVGIVGLGAEYLENASTNTITSVIDEAIDNGVNYIDLFMASPNVRDNFGIALRNRRQKVMVAGHLGVALKNGQYYKTRDNTLANKYFDDLLIRLKTNYIDVLMIHFVDEPDDYETVFSSEGLFKLAIKLKREGKARFIGMSSHKVPVALKVVKTGTIDVLMFAMNPAFDTLPADVDMDAVWQDSTSKEKVIAGDKSKPQRKELYQACAVQGVGIVAMKPYAAGRLFIKENPSSIVLTPVQCINYVLSQPGVCTVVPGCKNAEEMKAAVAFLNATDEEKDYIAIANNQVWKLRGNCMYCNHCLPCPVGIDIGTSTRLTDIATYGMTNSIISEYKALSLKASSCTSCGVCMEKCPFGVDVVENMARAVTMFGE